MKEKFVNETLITEKSDYKQNLNNGKIWIKLKFEQSKNLNRAKIWRKQKFDQSKNLNKAKILIKQKIFQEITLLAPISLLKLTSWLFIKWFNNCSLAVLFLTSDAFFSTTSYPSSLAIRRAVVVLPIPIFIYYSR